MSPKPPPASPAAAAHEPQPGPHDLTSPSSSSHDGVDYAPNPASSIPLSARRQTILRAITALYSGSASEADMRVYAADAVYDDPLSYCDSRYKIAGQWYGIPKMFRASRTLATEVVRSSEGEKAELIFKLRQEYTFPGNLGSKTIDSLVSLGLAREKPAEGGEEVEVVKYHKDMWNEKDYSHQGLGFFFKKANGDSLTGVTKPPKDL